MKGLKKWMAVLLIGSFIAGSILCSENNGTENPLPSSSYSSDTITQTTDTNQSYSTHSNPPNTTNNSTNYTPTNDTTNHTTTTTTTTTTTGGTPHNMEATVGGGKEIRQIVNGEAMIPTAAINDATSISGTGANLSCDDGVNLVSTIWRTDATALTLDNMDPGINFSHNQGDITFSDSSFGGILAYNTGSLKLDNTTTFIGNGSYSTIKETNFNVETAVGTTFTGSVVVTFINVEAFGAKFTDGISLFGKTFKAETGKTSNLTGVHWENVDLFWATFGNGGSYDGDVYFGGGDFTKATSTTDITINATSGKDTDWEGRNIPTFWPNGGTPASLTGSHHLEVDASGHLTQGQLTGLPLKDISRSALPQSVIDQSGLNWSGFTMTDIQKKMLDDASHNTSGTTIVNAGNDLTALDGLNNTLADDNDISYMTTEMLDLMYAPFAPGEFNTLTVNPSCAMHLIENGYTGSSPLKIKWMYKDSNAGDIQYQIHELSDYTYEGMRDIYKQHSPVDENTNDPLLAMNTRSGLGHVKLPGMDYVTTTSRVYES